MANYNQRELCLIWLDSFIGLEYKNKQALYSLLLDKSGIRNIILQNKEYITSLIGENEYNTLYSSACGEYFNAVIEELDKKGITALTVISENYPQALKETSHPPLVLYTVGDLGLLDANVFAVVGSRKSLPISESIAKRYVKELVNAGFTVCTGIAEGIDKTVLQTALEENSKPISVIAGGIDNIYPASNRNIFDRVCQKGLVISEYPPQVKALPFHYPIRNRIIAGLSRGTLIISGGKKSGTLYTAEYAEEYGRDLFAVPYSVGIVSGAGCNDLIKRGAMLTDEPEDILNFYGIEKKEKKIEQFSDCERDIIKVLADGELHIDKICSLTGRMVFEITPTLSVLEIKGIVVKSGVNVFCLSRNDLEE